MFIHRSFTFSCVLMMVLGVTVCLPGIAWGGMGFQPVSPDELKMTSEPLALGAPAIILYREVDRDDSRINPHEDNYIRIKILTEEGRRYANVELPFVKNVDEIHSLKARTIRPDGSIVNFDGKILEAELVKGSRVRVLAKTFALPDVQVGSIIEYSYTMSFLFLFDSHWILSGNLFTKKAQFSLLPANGYWSSLSLNCVSHGLPAGASPKWSGHLVQMEAENIPAFQAEDHMPPADEMKSRVDFVYGDGFTDSNPERYWKRVGINWNEQLEIFVGKRKEMEQAVAQIVSPNDSQEVKLRKIYDRVQQIRNTTYELRKTEQELKREKEKPPQNVEDVWKRSHGDGIQLTWLFLGLVRAAGFEAYGCWVSSRREYFFDPATMEKRKLNSDVVLVKLNGKDLYLDPGGAFTPFGLLEWSETAVKGLRLDKDGGTWIQTTIPQASDSRIEHVGKLKLADTGDLEGRLTVTYTGLEAMYHRREERHADEVARKKYLEEWVKSQIGVAAEAELTNKPDWTSSETPLVAEFDLKIPGWASNAGKRVVIPAAIFTAAEKGLFEHANRVHPVYFSFPYEKADDMTIELPPGWQVSSVPPPQNPSAGAVVYSLKVEPTPGTLRLTRKLTINVFLLEQKYYAALRSFFQIVRSGDGEQIVLQPGETHASN